jgi:hypothetical protein
MRVKVFITLKLDPEEYVMPADENPSEELEEQIVDLMHEIEGVEIKNIKILTE